jgi:thiosulfate/3-mercaptopyruvate sulfurtransferase
MSQSGISRDTVVVLYGDNNNWFAAYALWQLKYYGHPDARLMNGGRKKWELEGRPFTVDVPHFTATNYKASDPDLSVRAKRDSVFQALETKAANLVDVRSVDEFTGKVIAPPGMTETAQRGGHIPGALNVPWAKAANEDGTFKSYDELAQLYQGVKPDQETIAYCRIGERSSHTWFVLKYLLGFDKVRNYDGSWTEWGNLVDAPIAKGEETKASVAQ